jgi:carbon-monoxide dehydrogenase small subunit
LKGEIMKYPVVLNVNGERYEVLVPAVRTLADVLRNDLCLTGTKIGCDMGECGTCTVLVDGKAVASCLMLAVDCNERDILTIEGLSKNGLHPIQEAFIKYGAVQCGFCTPGVILSIKGLLDRNASPSDQEIKESITGNLCRCTGYVKILEAVRRVRS